MQPQGDRDLRHVALLKACAWRGGSKPAHDRRLNQLLAILQYFGRLIAGTLRTALAGAGRTYYWLHRARIRSDALGATAVPAGAERRLEPDDLLVLHRTHETPGAPPSNSRSRLTPPMAWGAYGQCEAFGDDHKNDAYYC